MAYRQDESLVMRVVRRVVPWIVLVAIALTVWGWVGQYRDSSGPSTPPTAEPSEAATDTVTPDGTDSDDTTDVAAPEGAGDAGIGTVKVLAQGLNMRAEPSTSAAVVKTLDADARLTLLEEGDGWYRVSDASGATGWVAAGGRYTEKVE